jgi:glutamate formiminotransferase
VPTRVNLAEVRRFPYEILKTSIQSDPSRRPDFGPSRLGPAGAVAIGARGPLIAFNAYLATDDIGVAQAIARTVRESGGGLTYLKALGLLVSGQAQVSMNVIDYRQTGLHLILETVRAEASKHGTVVTHTELVGLVPRMALIDAALAYLGLPQDAGKLTLETRIGLVTGDFRDLPFE